MRHALLFLLLLASTVLPASAQWKSERDFRFKNGDRILIGVFKSGKSTEDVMKDTVTLDGGGQATLNNGQRVKVGFGNFKSAMAAIEEGFRTGDDLRGLNVEAQIIQHNGTPVVLALGELRTPGHTTWKDGLTLADVVARAGGFTDDADKKRVSVQRAATRIVIDCRVENAAKEFRLEAGDSITVDISPMNL